MILPPEPSSPTAQIAREPRRRRVLIVDDHAESTEILSVLVQLDGHQVRTALDGADALRVASAFLPEVALIDLGLPGVDGLDVARSLRREARFARTYLIALTGRAEPETQRQCHDAGFDRVVTKPILDHDALRTLISGV